MNTGNERLLSSGMFESLINDFYEYMDLASKPKPATIDKWFENLSNIIESDICLAFGKMKDTENQKPKNLPKAIRAALFLVWGDQGKDLRAWVNYGPCPDCNSSGFFVIRYYHEGQKSWPECIIFCKSCNNYLNLAHSSAPRASAQFLRMKNARFKPGKPFLRDGPIIEGNVKTISAKLEDKMAIPSVNKKVGGTGRHLSDAEKQAFIDAYEK